MEKAKRSYIQRVRKEKQEETRKRIVDALVELHEEVGPKNTSIAAVAKRAGVQRLTVYRHFEDETAMFAACSGKWIAENPLPDERAWAHADTALGRAGLALKAIYGYYSKTESMLGKVYRDASEVEALGPIVANIDAYFNSIADALSRDIDGGKPSRDTIAVCRHLVRFSTWQSFSKERLSTSNIARIGVSWLEAVSPTA